MKKHLKYLLTGLAVATLAACGGGGGSASSVASLTGTAAVGAPLPNATVVLKDATGKTLTQTADANGAYTFPDVSGLTAPLMLEASGTAGGTSYTLHSLLATAPAAGVSGVINVSPHTEAAVAQATGQDPATVFADPVRINAVDATKLADAKAKLNAALADTLTALGLDPSKVDLFTTAFKADNTGLDKLLDLVSVSSDATTGGRAMQVTNKSTQVSSTIAPDAAVTSVTKLEAPSAATLALDTSSIKTLLSSFNALSDTVAQINSAAMLDLFDANYLDDSLDRSAQIADIAANGVGIKITDYVLSGCDGATKVCNGKATLTRSDKSTEVFSLPVVLRSDGKWRAYGKQNPFEFDLKSVVYQQNYVGTNAPAPTLQTGFNFWFTGYVGNNPSSRTYKSAKLYSSTDGGTTWTLSTSLKLNTSCGDSFLPIDGAGCTNFKTVSASATASNNAAQAAGNKWFKIEAYPNADYTGTPTTYQHRSTHPLFDATTGAAAVAASGLGITISELDSNSVSFVGNADLVYIRIISAGATTTVNSATWSDTVAIKALNGKATVAAALTQCGSSCTSAYGTDAKISSIRLNKRDPQGRGVWVQYSKGSTATSSSTTTTP